MCTPARKFDRVTSLLLAVGLLSNFCALNFFHDHDFARGFLAGFGLVLEMTAFVRIARDRFQK